jgi:hypothetical protein
MLAPGDGKPCTPLCTVIPLEVFGVFEGGYGRRCSGNAFFPFRN